MEFSTKKDIPGKKRFNLSPKEALYHSLHAGQGSTELFQKSYEIHRVSLLKSLKNKKSFRRRNDFSLVKEIEGIQKPVLTAADQPRQHSASNECSSSSRHRYQIPHLSHNK